jgi:hypothetical protein
MTSKEWAEVERREVMAMEMSSQEEVCRREERIQIGIGLLPVGCDVRIQHAQCESFRKILRARVHR